MALMSAQDFLKSKGSSPGPSSAPQGLMSAKDFMIQKEQPTTNSFMQSEKTFGTPNLNPSFPSAQSFSQPQPAPSLADRVQSFNAPDANGNLRTNFPLGFLNPLNDINRIENSPIMKTLQHGAGQAMGLQQGDMPAAQPSGSKVVDTITNLLGQGAGYLTNPAQIEQNVGNVFFNNPIVQKAGNKVGSLIASKLPQNAFGRALSNTAEQAVVGGLGSAAYAPTQTLNSGGSLQDIPKNVLEQGLMGGALGGAGGAIGSLAKSGLSTIGQKYAGTKLGDALNSFFGKNEAAVTEAPQGQLALPPASDASMARYNKMNGNVLPTNTEPIYGQGDIHTFALPESPQYNAIQRIKAQQTLGLPEATPQTVSDFNRRNGNVLPTNTTPIIGKGDIAKPLGLPQGNYVNPTRLKVINKEDAFLSVIPKVIAQATERMTPPLENANELAKWVQGHLNDAGHNVSLNEVRGLNYEDLRQIAEEIKPRLNTAEIARKTAQDMGYGKVFDMTTPTIKEQLAKDVQSQVYGVPAPKVDIQRPSSFNVQHEGAAATPKQGLSFKREPKLSDLKASIETPQQMQQRYERQIKEANDRKQISDLSKPIIGRAAMPETKIKFNQKQPNITQVKKAINQDGNISFDKSKFDQKVADKVLKKEVPISATQDITPHADVRVRDKITNYLDEAAQAARDRLKAKRNTLSSNPVDQYSDYAIIGASHIANGAVKIADFSEKMIKDFGESIKPHLKEIFNRSKAVHKEAERQASGVAHLPGVNSGVDPLKGDKVKISRLDDAIANSGNWKDKNRLLLNRETATRNNEDVMGKDSKIMNETYIEPVQKSAADRQRFITQERSDIKDLGIKYKSPEDALVQKYGEGKMTEAELKVASPQNWQKIKTAAETMRAKYDKYLGMANEVLKRNGYPEIPKRKDYFPHYEEIDGLMSKLGFGFEDNTLPSDLNGLTANLKPGKNFFTHALQRKGTDTTLGAMAGHDRYIEGISKIIHQTDNIKHLRGLDKTLRDTHEGTTHLSDFLANLTDYTNILAGKKTEMDRSLEAATGRNLYSAADWLKRRVGANMVGGSISSALTNSIPVTQLLAETSKTSVLKGLASALHNIKGNDAISQESDFLTRRFTSHKLAMGPIDKAQNAAGLLFKGIDHFTSNVVMRSKYYENIDKKGMPQAEALKEADKYATRMMADRSEGSMPTLFHSRTFGLITQFQLEVNNQLSHLFKDMPKSMSKAKYASAITQVFIYDYLYNQVYEKVTGNRPAFDPLGVASQAIQDYTNPRLSKGKASGNLIGNIANNLPFASVATGGRIPLGAAMPNVFGSNGLIKGNAKVGDELLKPAKYLALPFGGSQINKTITGINAVNQGGVKGKDTNGNEILKYPIEKSPANIARGSLFGKSALPETNRYYNNNTPSLTANETKILENSSDPKATYTKILQRKEIDGLKTQLTKVRNERIPLDEKKKQLDQIMSRLQKASR